MKDLERTPHIRTFNVSYGACSEVTVYSWELPLGYDYTVETADPMLDIIDLSPKVHFTLMNSDPDASQESYSDGYRLGAVHFQTLHPGEYLLDGNEIHEHPSDQIFWECFGFEDKVVRSAVVNDHHELQFSIKGGEHIMCHRFHIPHNQQVHRPRVD